MIADLNDNRSAVINTPKMYNRSAEE